MPDLPPDQKVFTFKLASWLPVCYRSYLRWLRGLLERLGHAAALAIWQDACQDAEDALLRQVLSTGWQADPPGDGLLVEPAIEVLFPQLFPAAVEGVTAQHARALVEQMPPIQQMRQALPSLQVRKLTSAEEALHLRLHGAARLCEALIQHHGKQGELIAYDLLREGRILAGGGRTGSVAEFIADFIAEPREPNLFSIGLQTELMRVTESEVVLHVRECAWARYFQAHHPTVGYLVACSTDEADYRAFNANLRMQRTSTLMEGGALCDFRVYRVE